MSAISGRAENIWSVRGFLSLAHKRPRSISFLLFCYRRIHCLVLIVVPTVDSFMIIKKVVQDMRLIKRAADEGAVEAGRGAG
jgi:hypothetical protein